MVEITNMEEWKPTYIDGVSVSSYGRVRKDSNGYIYRLRINKSNGYKYVDLRHYKNGKMIKVARLVALTFLPNPLNKGDVDHINAVRTDDRLQNLRWCSRKENMANPNTIKKIKSRGFVEHPKSRKAILQFSKDGIFIKEWDSATTFSKSIGKDAQSNIIACIKGRQSSAYGYKWKYKK